MKKLFISLSGGLLIGVILSFTFMDYQNMSYEVIGVGGIDKRTIRELDFEFVFNASLLVIGCTILIFAVWSYIDKKKDQRFHENASK